MAIGIVSRAAAGEEARRAELAERDRRGEPGGGDERPAQVRRTSTSPPRPRSATRRASPRPRAGCGSMPRSTGSTVRTTNGTATSAWPTGTSHHDARQSTGGVSNVMSMPKPIVTADVASGSISPVSSSRPPRRAAAMASAASDADDDGDDGRREPSCAATSPATPAGRPRRMTPGRTSDAPSVAPGRERVPVAAAQRPLDEREQRRDHEHRRGQRRRRRRARAAGAPRRALPRPSGRRAERPAVRGAAAAPTTISAGGDRQQLQRPRATAAAPMSPSCVARRQISTSIVDVPAPPSTRTTPNDVNVNRKTIDAAASNAGRSSGSVISRNARHGEAPSVRAAASRSGGQVLPHGADGAHDDGEVEHDVGERGSPATPRSQPRRAAAARTAAPITTVGSTNGDGDSAPSRRRPAEPEAGEHVGRGQPDDQGERRAERPPATA